MLEGLRLATTVPCGLRTPSAWEALSVSVPSESRPTRLPLSVWTLTRPRSSFSTLPGGGGLGKTGRQGRQTGADQGRRGDRGEGRPAASAVGCGCFT